MLNSALLKVSCAMASDSPIATLTAGMTGMNRCTASGPTNEIEASANAKSGPGVAFMKGGTLQAGARKRAGGAGFIHGFAACQNKLAACQIKSWTARKA